MGYLYLFQQARTFVVADRGSKGKVLFLLRDLTQNVRILGNRRFDGARGGKEIKLRLLLLCLCMHARPLS